MLVEVMKMLTVGDVIRRIVATVHVDAMLMATAATEPVAAVKVPARGRSVHRTVRPNTRGRHGAVRTAGSRRCHVRQRPTVSGRPRRAVLTGSLTGQL